MQFSLCFTKIMWIRHAFNPNNLKGRGRQEDKKFKVIFSFMGSSRLAGLCETRQRDEMEQGANLEAVGIEVRAWHLGSRW